MSMTFADKFAAIWQFVFGLPPSKPRLKSARGLWTCSSADGRIGHGVNPRMAYSAWLSLRDECRPGGYALMRGHVPPRPMPPPAAGPWQRQESVRAAGCDAALPAVNAEVSRDRRRGAP